MMSKVNESQGTALFLLVRRACGVNCFNGQSSFLIFQLLTFFQTVSYAAAAVKYHFFDESYYVQCT